MSLSLTAYPTLEDVVDLDWQSFLDCGGLIDREGLEHVMKLKQAIWLYDGEPRADTPHALLASGLHSDGFLNVGVVVKEVEPVCFLLANALVKKSLMTPIIGFDSVFGAATSSTPLAAAIAQITGAQHLVLEKTSDGEQVWSESNRPVPPDTTALQIEELITTSGSGMKARQAVAAANPTVRFLPYCLTVVDRSAADEPVRAIGSSTLISLTRYEIGNFPPETCKYCAAGSKALKPKEHAELFFGRAA